MANILPDAISRLTTKECSMNGYLIPKGTPVTAQISAVLYDDKVGRAREIQARNQMDPHSDFQGPTDLQP